MSLKALSLVVAALSVSAPAFADRGVEFVNNEIGYQAHAMPSATSRAQVLAELRAAQQAGSIPDSFEFALAEERSPSPTTREQVQRALAETTVAEQHGTHRIYGPDHALGS